MKYSFLQFNFKKTNKRDDNRNEYNVNTRDEEQVTSFPGKPQQNNDITVVTTEKH